MQKFRTGVINNTVAPRKLSRIARAVERKELAISSARRVVHNIIARSAYTVDDAFRDSVEQVDFEHTLTTLIERVAKQLAMHRERGFAPAADTRKALQHLADSIRDFIRQS